MKNNEIKKLFAEISDELLIFEKNYKSILQSRVNLINEIGRHISKAKGKRIRPALLLLCAKYFGDIDEKIIDAATIVELLHTATLIHDDVVDKADKRRGQKSINNRWENKIAVLMGDFLFSRSLLKLVALEHKDILNDISRTTEHLSTGELLQIEKSNDQGMSESIYYEMIFYKTASLFSTSCKIGAKLKGATRQFYRSMENYGKYFGMAFQIKDDLFDITGKTENTGKPIGLDVKQNILTLPVIYTMDRLDSENSEQVQEMMESKSEIDVEELSYYVEKAGGFEYSRQKIDEYSRKAKNSLTIIRNNEIKQSLLALVDYNVNRKR
jgi:octaprenyl-diphosphate synthase